MTRHPTDAEEPPNHGWSGGSLPFSVLHKGLFVILHGDRTLLPDGLGLQELSRKELVDVPLIAQNGLSRPSNDPAAHSGGIPSGDDWVPLQMSGKTLRILAYVRQLLPGAVLRRPMALQFVPADNGRFPVRLNGILVGPERLYSIGLQHFGCDMLHELPEGQFVAVRLSSLRT